MKKRNLIGYGLPFVTALIFNGCGAAGYQLAPNSKQEVTQDTKVEFDQFKKQTSIATPPYLIRNGFTDQFPVIVSYKAIKKDSKIQAIHMNMKVLGTEQAIFNQAIGEDGYEFKFEEISAEDGAGITTKIGQYSSTTPVKKETFNLYFTMEQLKKMSSKNYAIKVYGKAREGQFIMPNFISEAFLSKLLEFDKQ